MAKGCIKYAIQEYTHPIGWETIGSPFRELPQAAKQRFEKFCQDWQGGMIRLAEIRVLEQYDPSRTKRLENTR